MARLLPNWIQAYMAYTAEQESPDEYHTWVALSTIAGAIRRRAYFDMGYFNLYPNLYAVLVGPAGRCKKSTAMRIGRELLANVPGANFTSDSTTRERLIQDLSQIYSDGHSSMTAYSTEFASLLTSSGMDMVVFLTDIYDSPSEWSHRTKMGGTNKIRAPYLNLLGATTPDWIAKALPLDTIGVGLTSRVVFIYQDSPRIREPFPELSPQQKQLKQLLLSDLIEISLISGEYKLTSTAKSVYEKWYKERLKDPNPTGDPRLAGYYERKPMHVLKIAMLVMASGSNDTVITEEAIQQTFALLNVVEPRMQKVFAAVGKNPLTYDLEQVTGAIVSHPGITFSELLAMFRHSVRKEELEEVLETLRAAGFIKQPVSSPQGPKYFIVE
jgi:Protein of unknown function (DUF3987)